MHEGNADCLESKHASQERCNRDICVLPVIQSRNCLGCEHWYLGCLSSNLRGCLHRDNSRDVFLFQNLFFKHESMLTRLDI